MSQDQLQPPPSSTSTIIVVSLIAVIFCMGIFVVLGKQPVPPALTTPTDPAAQATIDKVRTTCTAVGNVLCDKLVECSDYKSHDECLARLFDDGFCFNVNSSVAELEKCIDGLHSVECNDANTWSVEACRNLK